MTNKLTDIQFEEIDTSIDLTDMGEIDATPTDIDLQQIEDEQTDADAISAQFMQGNLTIDELHAYIRSCRNPFKGRCSSRSEVSDELEMDAIGIALAIL